MIVDLEPFYFDEVSKAFAEHWLELFEKTGGIPRRRDFNPMRLPKVMPYLYIASIEGGEYTLRLAGTALRDIFGQEMQGKQVSDIISPEELEQSFNYTQTLLTTPCAGLLQRVISRDSGVTVRAFSTAFPLANNAGDKVLVIGTMTTRAFEADVDVIGQVTDIKVEKRKTQLVDLGFGVPEGF